MKSTKQWWDEGNCIIYTCFWMTLP